MPSPPPTVASGSVASGSCAGDLLSAAPIGSLFILLSILAKATGLLQGQVAGRKVQVRRWRRRVPRLALRWPAAARIGLPCLLPAVLPPPVSRLSERAR